MNASFKSAKKHNNMWNTPMGFGKSLSHILLFYTPTSFSVKGSTAVQYLILKKFHRCSIYNR